VSGPAGFRRPAWASCAYVDGTFAEHWHTLGRVTDREAQEEFVVDVAQYDSDGSAEGPFVRVGGSAFTPAEAQRLVGLIEDALLTLGAAASLPPHDEAWWHRYRSTA
jgi:hypothetical protein